MRHRPWTYAPLAATTREKPGKTKLVASTHGAVAVGANGAKLSLNLMVPNK